MQWIAKLLLACCPFTWALVPSYAQQPQPAACGNLTLALQRNDIKSAESAIQNGCPVGSSLDGSGATALLWSTSGEMTRALIAAGADVNQQSNLNESPLGPAAFHGKLDIIQILIAAGAHDGNGTWACSAICEAVSSSSPKSAEIVRLLLSSGASAPNATNCLNATALFVAAVVPGREQIMADLIANGADPNWYETSQGDPLIVVATKTGRTDVVQRLLRAGADPNWPNARSCRTALHAAAEAGNLSVVQELIAKGADPSAADNGGVTPRGAAEKAGHADVVSFLASRSAPSTGVPRTDCVNIGDTPTIFHAWNDARTRTRDPECADMIRAMQASGR